MNYTGTRSAYQVGSAQAIASGIAADGGLFVPESFPRLTAGDFAALARKNYRDRAAAILPLYLTDYTSEEIRHCVDGAYRGTFEHDAPAPLVDLGGNRHMLELWHGPTCAFKDLALQILPYLLTAALNKVDKERTAVILVATSGDTGKAALAGFSGVERTRIIVFYPRDGVSDMQKLQMITQRGNNVAVCAIEGNFDLLNRGALAPGGEFNVAVPTGNFGNILAAVYAKRMGVPIKKFICASNANNVLTDFIRTGVYDRNRPFHTTESPSMDILISSNLERYLYHLSGNDPKFTAAKMAELRASGRYELPPALRNRLQEEFFGGCCDDAAGRAAIAEIFLERHYLCDPHTAVALAVYEQYRQVSGDSAPCVIASTASPYKFAPAVLKALTDRALPADDFAKLELLAELSGTSAPSALAGLKGEPIRHRDCVPRSGMAEFIRNALN